MSNSTDFYVESDPSEKLGFPPGVSEQLVVNTLRKWQSIRNLSKSSVDIETPPAIQEVTVNSEESFISNEAATCSSEILKMVNQFYYRL